MNESNTSVPVSIRILGIFSVLGGIITVLIGGGILFSMLMKNFMDAMGLTVGSFLLISGILKIWSVFVIWKIRRTGMTLYMISEILLIAGLITFMSGYPEMTLILFALISLVWSVIFILIFGLFIRNKLNRT